MHMDFKTFETRIGYSFKNGNLLEQAFTHRSYLNENRAPGREHNERLEFLGDAVLELVVTEFLYGKYPDKPEGDLTSYRAALVNTVSISDAATKLGMNEYLLLSRGEARDTGRARAIILANAFEALIGALYLDGGYRAAEECVRVLVFPHLDEILEKKLYRDPKSLLQEVIQERKKITPTYRVLDERGPDHQKEFVLGVFFGDEEVARGTGTSKQEAELKAADAALELLKQEELS